MAIVRPGLGMIRFEYSGDGVLVAGRVEFMAVAVPGFWIPGLTEVRGLPRDLQTKSWGLPRNLRNWRNAGLRAGRWCRYCCCCCY